VFYYCLSLCSALHDSIILKLHDIAIGSSTSTNSANGPESSRFSKLNQALLLNLQELQRVKVDGSVLKKTGIAKTLKRVNTSQNQNVSPDCSELAASIIAEWKEQINRDNNMSTLRSLKGGNIVKMLPGTTLTRPQSIAPTLWNKFCALYNESQLFAIKYVSSQFEGDQDTRIVLVQGNVISKF
jgi:hypothetical protein